MAQWINQFLWKHDDSSLGNSSLVIVTCANSVGEAETGSS